MRNVIGIAIGAAVGFGLGVLATVAGGGFLLSYIGVGPLAKESYAASEVKRLEKELGIPCQAVEGRALRFITEQMSVLRMATQDGKPWISEGRDKFLDNVTILREQTSQCWMIQTQAQAGNLPYPGDFQKQQSILRSLSTLVTVSHNVDPNDEVMRKVFMEGLEKEYNDLTIGSSGRQTAADPKR